MLEVFNNLYMSIAEQMGAVLENTAASVTIKERLDFSCAVFDAAGDLIATEAGAVVWNRTGRPHRYNAAHPAADAVIAAPPVLGQALIGQLKRPAA